MTKTISFKLAEEDYKALCDFARGDSDRRTQSKILRDALKNLCIPNFEGASNPEGYPKGRKRRDAYSRAKDVQARVKGDSD